MCKNKDAMQKDTNKFRTISHNKYIDSSALELKTEFMTTLRVKSFRYLGLTLD